MSARKELGLVAATLLLAFLLFTLIDQRGAVGASSPKLATMITHAVQPAPELGWKLISSQEFAMQAGEGRRPPGGTTIGASGQFKLSVTATQPVSFGLDSVDSNGGHVICGANSVFSASPSCDVENGAVIRLFIQDERKLTLGDAAYGALALLWARNSKPIENDTGINRVHLEMFAWTCIRNCSP